jgi:hypothetical protein
MTAGEFVKSKKLHNCQCNACFYVEGETEHGSAPVNMSVETKLWKYLLLHKTPGQCSEGCYFMI